ncbi:hypothetical protein M2282_000354 [Variovorax boronicumulans]|uniref:alpha/beta hydrolase family protein n=1 Tax=Variovorax boronicumulans TaxID=436515 RepID=UPI002475A367|nr:alpha/beta hydrolase [Variovorax boronicumulans]MDH6165226.1 hypothetical protein [Variovorax boronicumulans]
MERRHFARSILAAVGAVALGANAVETGPQASAGESPAAAAPGLKPFLFEKDETFWYETLRSFGHIAYGGADFGEVVMTAQRIRGGDYDSWHDEWCLTADRVAAEAQQSLAAGHHVSARDAFFRASNYYRSAEFFLHGNPADPRINAAYDRSVECFRAAVRLADGAIEPVRIRYEGTSLPGYFYRAAGKGAKRRPTVVMHNGFDGSVEEMHYVAAAALAERGYNVLSFDGPGQPALCTAKAWCCAPTGSGWSGRCSTMCSCGPMSMRSALRCWATAWAACWRRARRRSSRAFAH